MSEATRTVTPPAGFAVPEARAESSAYVIVLCAVAALGGFLFGFDSGVINGAVAALGAAFGTHTATTGFAVASVLIGCAIGAFVAGRNRVPSPAAGKTALRTLLMTVSVPEDTRRGRGNEMSSSPGVRARNRLHRSGS